jgi:hypothetical protein
VSVLRDAALEYAAVGWLVFPCLPRRKKPPTDSHGLLDATTDLEQIRRWWDAMPNANIGVNAGASELLVVDVDPEGHTSLDELAAIYGWLPSTRVCWTPRGNGFHVYYRLPAGVEVPSSTGRLGAGIDVRSRGGYVLVPPSVHPNGGRYLWPDPDAVIAVAPAWLVELCRREEVCEAIGDAPGVHPSVRRPGYGLAALEREARAVAAAPVGTRNDTLNRAAHALARLVLSGDLDTYIVEHVLLAGAHDAGLPDREARATIRSALRARGITA